jgi:hypothetical protein
MASRHASSVCVPELLRSTPTLPHLDNASGVGQHRHDGIVTHGDLDTNGEGKADGAFETAVDCLA